MIKLLGPTKSVRHGWTKIAVGNVDTHISVMQIARCIQRQTTI